MEEPRVWVPHESTVFALAIVLEINEELQQVTVELESDGTIRKVNRATAHDVDRTHMLDLEDLCDMNNLHEAPLLDIVRRRLADDKIYTYTGNFLVSLNPYKYIPGLYDNPLSYLNMAPLTTIVNGSLVTAPKPSPHVYAIANNALRALEFADHNLEGLGINGSHASANQSIIITGESGAGKTEASKHVMTFLTVANNSQDHHQPSSSSSSNHGERIKAIILDSSVIFESFGNAKTVRNDNSSRFGKYIKLMYSPSNQLISAYTETFLLEKSRLVSIGKGERNYHIFYQLIRGLPGKDSSLSSSLRLHNVDAFLILTEGACTIVHSEEDDVNEFNQLVQALVTLGCSREEINCLWSLLAAILHLGNFTAIANGGDSDPCDLIAKAGGMSMDEIASILGVDATSLTKGITEQRMQAGKRTSLHVKMLSPVDAKNNVLALIKWLYKVIFGWIVRKVNHAHNTLEVDGEPHQQAEKFIGILDIFGFEILGINSFEQLCINYTNERLQQQFNEHVFVLEQQEYAKEGLDWKSISYRDNQPVIDLISKKPLGLLMILEEHGMMNRKPDDFALVNSFNQAHDKTQPAYVKSRFGNDRFIVKHFAGDVTYTVEGFISKNNDSLQEGLTEVVSLSTNVFLKNLLASDDSTGAVLMTSGPGFVPFHAPPAALIPSASTAEQEAPKKASAASVSSKKMASSITVSFYFRNQLDMLMATLRSTQPHYIKCIKPNAVKSADTFTASLVMEQLRYSGVLEVVRIRREGFPSKVPFVEFYRQYDVLAFGKRWVPPNECSVEQAKEYCTILSREYLPIHSYQIGTNFVFLGLSGPSDMLAAINNFYKGKATIIQSRFRRNKAVAQYNANRMKVLLVSTLIRMYLARLHFRRIRRQVIGIQKYYRLVLFKRLLADSNRRRVLKRRNDAATLIQSKARELRAKKVSKRLRKSFTFLQIAVSKWFRQRVCRHVYKKSIQLVVRLQCIIRKFVAKAKWMRSRRSAIRLQSRMRSALLHKRYFATRSKIIRIESWLRQRIQQKLFAVAKKATICVQSVIRKFIHLRRYRKSRRDIIRLQANFRGHSQRGKFARVYSLMIALQSVWRRYRGQKHFLRQRHSAIRVQARIRLHQAQRAYLAARSAISVCQRTARMWIVFKKYHRILRGIRRLQRGIRSFLRRRGFEAKEHASSLIQAQVRGRLARSSYRRQKQRITFLQSLVRRYLSWSAFKVTRSRVTLLQSRIRMCLQLFRYRATRFSTILIQQVFRRYAALQQYQRQKRAIIKIQSFYRMIVEMASYDEAQFSILMIQTHFRKHSASTKYKRCKEAIIVLQAAVRRSQAQVNYQRCMQAASRITALCRMFNAVRQYEVIQFSVLLIQSQVRRFLLESRFFLMKFSALVLQAKAREFIARRDYQNCRRAIIRLQSFGRALIAQNAYDVALFSVVFIQTSVRKFLCSARYFRQRHAAIKMEAFFRMAKAQSLFRLKKYAVTMIASVARMRSQYMNYLIWKQCALLLHKRARGITARLAYQKARRSAIKIQSCGRMYIRLVAFRRMWHASLRVSMAYRSFCARVRLAELQYCYYRLGLALRAHLRNRILFKRLSNLHRAYATGDMTQIRSHLTKYPQDAQIRYKWSSCGSLLHSAVFGGQLSLLTSQGIKPSDLLTRNRNGDNLLLALVQSPDYATLNYFADMINGINTKVEYEVKDEDDDDDEPTKGEDSFAASAGFGSDARLTDAISGLPILMTGWMKKKRNSAMIGFKKWNRRWCVLTEETLTYYKTDARNSKPCGFLPLEGCTIDRLVGKEAIITVVSPQTVFKKGMFGDKMVGPLVLQVETEMDLQGWLNPLKAAAGVTPFRAEGVSFSNTELRESWLRKANLNGDGPLHCLARASELWFDSPLGEFGASADLLTSVDSAAALVDSVSAVTTRIVGKGVGRASVQADRSASVRARNQCRKRFTAMTNLLGESRWNAAAKAKMQEDALKIASWLICAGCSLDNPNAHGSTPLQLALESGNHLLIMLFVRRGADTSNLSPAEKTVLANSIKFSHLGQAEPWDLISAGILQPTLPSPPKLKGYSFVQFWVRRQFSSSADVSLDSIENPCLTISLYNSKLELVEPPQEYICPAFVSASNMWWGHIWHMQTPIENLEDNCFVVIKYGSMLSMENFKRKELSWSSCMIKKASIDTANAVFTLVPGPADLDTAAKNDGNRVSYSNSTSASASNGVKLEVGIVMTKKFRQTDMEMYL